MLFPYRAHLEDEVKYLKAETAARLSDKDTLIRSLRIELSGVKAENERMRLVLMPLGSPAGQMYAVKFQAGSQFQGQQSASTPSPPASIDWQGELNKMLQEEEDGIRSRGRIQEHEPSTDDGA